MLFILEGIRFSAEMMIWYALEHRETTKAQGALTSGAHCELKGPGVVWRVRNSCLARIFIVTLLRVKDAVRRYEKVGHLWIIL